jgi:hypothetical protein
VQLFDHRRRQLDAVNTDRSPTQWQGEATSADPKLEGTPLPSQVSKEADHWLDDLRIEQMRPQVLVALRDPRVEVVLGHIVTLLAKPTCEQSNFGCIRAE